VLSDSYICSEPKKRKPRATKPKPVVHKPKFTLHIDGMVLNPLQFTYRDIVEPLGVKVHRGTLILSKEDSIAFRSTLTTKEMFYTNHRNMEVHYEGKCRTIDKLNGCRIMKIENNHTQGEQHVEKIKLTFVSIEYGKVLETQERE
jgi:hypothetical protein